MRSGVSPAGVKYAVRRSGRSVAYCALSVGCGTVQEAGFPSGTAHFVEHTLFRGTRLKKASVINSYLDRLGGELNAYTTKEEIVLHATVLKEDIWKAARLLFELSTEPTFPDDEIETERGVVLDEIISYKDNPAEDVYDKFEGLLFQGHPLEQPILGTTASVKKITPEQLRRFVATFFTPERMAFTLVADAEEEALEKKVLRLLESIFPAPETRLPSTRKNPAPMPATPPFRKVVDKRNHEVNAVIGCQGPSLYQMPDRMTTAMLVNILGGPASNSLLNNELREKRGWVYGIECTYTQYADTGIVAISFGCDRPNLEKCRKAIGQILARLCEKPLSETRLRSYRKQLLGQLAIASEAGEAQCLSMGKSLLAWGQIMSPEETKARLEAITPEDIRQMAARLFSPENLSSLIYL
ncbi:MAG: insulinase family protein [Bacteroidales bacterium]|nr:insulinase family protein [Bacteroidales bacterium]